MFWARPDEPLREHLDDVGGYMARRFSEQKNLINLGVLPSEEFFYLVGFSHDFGKYTSYFQNYLKTGKPAPMNLQHHSLISAFYSVWRVSRITKDRRLWYVAFFVVKHHHGDFSDVDLNEIDRDFIGKQLDDISTHSKSISQDIRDDIDGFVNWMRDLDNVLRELGKGRYGIEKENSLDWYYLASYVFSLLVSGDKFSSAGVQKFDRISIPHDIVDRYRSVRFRNSGKHIDKLRNEIYNEVMGRFFSFQDSSLPSVLSVNAPTGMGKTLINLSLALKVRHRKNYPSRIIYALPFTSIIDQTYDVLEEILGSTIENYRTSPHRYLIKHHHLAEVTYRIDSEDVPLSEALLLVDSWESEIIITTFVQLFHSLIAYRNRLLKRFHNLVGSVIVLDEIQNIPAEYWEIVRKFLKDLSKKFSIHIIFSTATKPLIFEEGEYEEMVENQKKYVVVRTRSHYKKEINNLETMSGVFLESVHEANSHLVVLNSINSSLRFYDMIKNGLNGYNLFYLSSNIVPRDRRYRINEIKKLLAGGERVVLVSTQVVEAGVDLDFDRVWRDIGPFDSIVQVSGRCNRNYRLPEGEVIIVRLEEKRGLVSSAVYGSLLPYITDKLLEERNTFDESDYMKMVEEYYNMLLEKGFKGIAGEKYKKIYRDLSKFKFNEIRKFAFIENLPYYIDVFVQIDEESKEIFEEFVVSVLGEKDIKKRQENYARLRGKFRDFVISIPVKYADGIEMEPYPNVPLDLRDEFYDMETGFKRILEERVDIW